MYDYNMEVQEVSDYGMEAFEMMADDIADVEEYPHNAIAYALNEAELIADALREIYGVGFWLNFSVLEPFPSWWKPVPPYSILKK